MNPWIHCDKNTQEPKTIAKDSERKDSTSSGREREKERINCNCYGFIVIEAIVHCQGTPMKTGSWWKCRLLSVLSVFCMIVFGFFLVSFLCLWFYFSLYFAPHWFCHLKRKTTPIITISHGNNFWGLFNSIFALCVANWARWANWNCGGKAAQNFEVYALLCTRCWGQVGKFVS